MILLEQHGAVSACALHDPIHPARVKLEVSGDVIDLQGKDNIWQVHAGFCMLVTAGETALLKVHALCSQSFHFPEYESSSKFQASLKEARESYPAPEDGPSIIHASMLLHFLQRDVSPQWVATPTCNCTKTYQQARGE
jgi:hypothetical protein